MGFKIVKPFKHIKTYNLEFTIDDGFMEVNGIKFSPKFEQEIDDLPRCDLIQDLIHHLEKDKTRSFNRYYKTIKPKDNDKPKA